MTLGTSRKPRSSVTQRRRETRPSLLTVVFEGLTPVCFRSQGSRSKSGDFRNTVCRWPQNVPLAHSLTGLYSSVRPRYGSSPEVQWWVWWQSQTLPSPQERIHLRTVRRRPYSRWFCESGKGTLCPRIPRVVSTPSTKGEKDKASKKVTKRKSKITRDEV